MLLSSELSAAFSGDTMYYEILLASLDIALDKDRIIQKRLFLILGKVYGSVFGTFSGLFLPKCIDNL